MTGNRILVVAVAVALVVGACGGDDDAGDTTTAATAESTTAAPDTTGAPTTEAPGTTAGPDTTSAGTDAPTGAVVAIVESDLGPILVDGDGFALYLFGRDEGDVSACTGACADNWPAVAAPATAGDGVDAALLGSAAQDDGSEQVTYNGHLLYRFAGDAAPGDTTGQGINDVWYVVSPTGEPVTDAPVAEAIDGY